MSFPQLAFPWYLPLVVGLALMSGGCAAPVAVAGASYGADGTLLVASHKTVSDHFVSMVSKQDCALWRVFRSRPVCKEREGDKNPYEVDYDHPQRMVGEDGAQYVPPLHAAADAPATSWDAAAYTPPPSAPAPKGPVTAVADAAPEPAPAAPSAAAPKYKKPKAAKPARSVKKPSRGPVAPAS